MNSLYLLYIDRLYIEKDLYITLVKVKGHNSIELNKESNRLAKLRKIYDLFLNLNFLISISI